VVPFFYPAGSFAALLNASTTVRSILTLTACVKHRSKNNLKSLLYLCNTTKSRKFLSGQKKVGKYRLTMSELKFTIFWETVRPQFSRISLQKPLTEAAFFTFTGAP
jgi:hypothetical protein